MTDAKLRLRASTRPRICGRCGNFLQLTQYEQFTAQHGAVCESCFEIVFAENNAKLKLDKERAAAQRAKMESVPFQMGGSFRPKREVN